MKINKKLLIPVFATAMGLSVIGGVGGAVAWYQYNTKVQGSFMGVTTADGGVLQITNEDDKWDRFAKFGDADTKLHPVTFGALEASGALSGTAKKHPHAGVTDMDDWDDAVEGTDYHQITFKIRAQKLNPTSKTYEPVAANVYLEDLILDSAPASNPIANALRVHISANGSDKLYSKAGGTIQTNGKLDLDRDENTTHNDIEGGWAWDWSEEELEYGAGTQTANQFVASASHDASSLLFQVPASADGIEVTMTIWLEGWEQIGGSSIWNATNSSGVEIHFGMKLGTPKATFLEDAD